MSLQGRVSIKDSYQTTETIEGQTFKRVPEEHVPRELWEMVERHPSINIRVYEAKSNGLAGDPDVYAIAQVAFSGRMLEETIVHCISGDLSSENYTVQQCTLASTGQVGWR